MGIKSLYSLSTLKSLAESTLTISILTFDLLLQKATTILELLFFNVSPASVVLALML